MLCRRCGMESSTTDVCEWCKQPMLPAGGTAPGETDREAAQTEERPAEGAAAAPAGRPEGAPEEQEQRAEGAEEQVLRPLGTEAPAQTPSSSAPGMPSHGISAEKTETSVDVSQFTGGDESIFRPVARSHPSGKLPGGADPLARTGGGLGKMEVVSDIPENVRLVRATLFGVGISVVLALVQFIISRTVEEASSVPTSLIFASVTLIRSLGKSDALPAVLAYGALVGAIMGLGLGAILVRFRRGPFIGMIIGLLVGYGLMNYPWGLITGAVTGIAAGIIATVGLRQVVQV